MLGIKFDCVSESHYLFDEITGVVKESDIFLPPSSVTVMGIAGVTLGYIFVEKSDVEPNVCVRIITRINKEKKQHYGVRVGAKVSITSVGNITAKCINVDTL